MDRAVRGQRPAASHRLAATAYEAVAPRRAWAHCDSSHVRTCMIRHQRPHWTILGGIMLSVALNAAGQICFKAARMAQPDASVLALFLPPETWGGVLIYGLPAE